MDKKTVRSMGRNIPIITGEKRNEYNKHIMEIVTDILDTLTSSCEVHFTQHETDSKITSYYAVISVFYDRHSGTNPDALLKIFEIANIHGAKVGTGANGEINIFPGYM